jgi:hypothetical protein
VILAVSRDDAFDVAKHRSPGAVPDWRSLKKKEQGCEALL